MSIIELKNEPSNGLNLISLFAGCGGSSLGYKAAGYDIRLSVEWDKGAAPTYRDNFPETPVFQGDIGDLSIEEAINLSGLKPGELDVLDGSPPCQGFSSAGERKFSDERNQLFREYVRILEAYKPKAFIMENVSGLRKGKMRLMFAEMTKALKRTGYKVSCRELNAWWYGVPQNRTRLIWVGIRDDLPFEPSHPKPVVRRPISVKQALGMDALVDVNQYSRSWCSDSDWKETSGTMRAQQKPRIAIQRKAFGDGQESTKKNFEDEKENLSNWDDLENGNPVNTLTATRPPMLAGSYYYPGSTHRKRDGEGKPLTEPAQALTAIRPPSMFENMEVRYINIDEAKILQSFPPDFKISLYKYIGNSVPPLMAKAVGEHVANILRGKS